MSVWLWMLIFSPVACAIAFFAWAIWQESTFDPRYRGIVAPPPPRRGDADGL